MKRSVIFNCPRCDQKIEAPAAIAGQSFNCPTCGENLLAPQMIERTRRFKPSGAIGWVGVITLSLVIIGVPVQWLRKNYSELRKPETESQEAVRMKSEAESAMLTECSNVVVGITRIVQARVDRGSKLPTQWRGTVTAEFVNRVGGIERTNLQFQFYVDCEMVLGKDGEIGGVNRVKCRLDYQLPKRTVTASDGHNTIEGLFGITLGEILPANCVILETQEPKDGEITTMLTPPEQISEFNVSTTLNANTRRVIDIVCWSKSKSASEIIAQKDTLIAKFKSKFGDYEMDTSASDYTSYSWRLGERRITIDHFTKIPGIYVYCMDNSSPEIVKSLPLKPRGF